VQPRYLKLEPPISNYHHARFKKKNLNLTTLNFLTSLHTDWRKPKPHTLTVNTQKRTLSMQTAHFHYKCTEMGRSSLSRRTTRSAQKLDQSSLPITTVRKKISAKLLLTMAALVTNTQCTLAGTSMPNKIRNRKNKISKLRKQNLRTRRNKYTSVTAKTIAPHAACFEKMISHT